MDFFDDALQFRSVCSIELFTTIAIVVVAGVCFATTMQHTKPISVNFHFTRQCNYSCGFCFHTAKTSYLLPLDEQKRGLQELANAGMRKVNFSGGEPFLVERGKRVGELVRYCKETLRLESVTVVTNGSLVKERWFADYGKYLDILAVSCDSFDQDINAKIGRKHRDKDHVKSLLNVREWCASHNVLFKLNTVVNTYNKKVDMSEEINRIKPCRWKIFQALPIEGENAGKEALRQVEPFLITSDEFDAFIDRHKKVIDRPDVIVPESNTKMQNSYLVRAQHQHARN